MRMIRTTSILKIGLPLLVIGMTSCVKDPQSPGYEYMPDMYRSPAVEAYVDYENIETLSARVPAKGTIVFTNDSAKVIFNMPYPIPDTPEGYEQSAALKNPIPYSEAVLAEGKYIYEKFCTHCHGEKGDGQGSIVQNGKFDGIPAYNAGALQTLPEGKMFHVITFGKGMMGPHAGQLNKEERWKVVHYVRYLQHNGTHPDAFAIPASAN